jgi:hypothetical protein
MWGSNSSPDVVGRTASTTAEELLKRTTKAPYKGAEDDERVGCREEGDEVDQSEKGEELMPKTRVMMMASGFESEQWVWVFGR